MLFYQDLEEIIFNRHNLVESDELVVLSGYVGPNPVQKLENLPLKSTVIYGMYGADGIGKNLHNALVNLNNSIENTDIKYCSIPVHSKCYIWKRNNNIKHVLVGSANFSTNGLTTPFREVLAETTIDTFGALEIYLQKVLENCIACDSPEIVLRKKINIIERTKEIIDPENCKMLLYDPRTEEIPNASGLNWGQSPTAHTNKDDAYIPIRADDIRNYPSLFPPKQEVPSNQNIELGRPQRHNDNIDIIWDDGTTMMGLLEGNYPMDNTIYPKQISSFPNKRILGQYLRKRLGLESGQKVTREDLRRYGRDNITVSLQGEGIYYFDFSNN